MIHSSCTAVCLRLVVVRSEPRNSNFRFSLRFSIFVGEMSGFILFHFGFTESVWLWSTFDYDLQTILSI